MFKFSLQNLFLGFCVCMAFAPYAHAKRGKIETLTETSIRSFIEKTSHMTTASSDAVPVEEIKKYLEKHIEKNARFKTIMQFNMPGLPPQEQKISMGKDDFIENVEKGGSSVEDYEHLIEIENVKISSDGQKAFVKTLSTEMVTMPVPTETGGTEFVPVEGESQCTQILSLNDGVIQMYSASCTTTMNFLDY